MFNVLVDYPEEEEEFRIVEMTTTTHQPQLSRVLSATDILEMQDIVRKVPVAPYVIRYAMKFTRLSCGWCVVVVISTMRNSSSSSG